MLKMINFGVRELEMEVSLTWQQGPHQWKEVSLAYQELWYDSMHRFLKKNIRLHHNLCLFAFVVKFYSSCTCTIALYLPENRAFCLSWNIWVFIISTSIELSIDCGIQWRWWALQSNQVNAWDIQELWVGEDNLPYNLCKTIFKLTLFY